MNYRKEISELSYPSEQADLMEKMLKEGDDEGIVEIFDKLNPEFLGFLEFGFSKILHLVGLKKFASALGSIDDYDVIEVLQLLSATEVIEILDFLPTEHAVIIKNLLSYPKGTIGRVMNTGFISVPHYCTCNEAISIVKNSPHDDNNHIFIMNEKGNALGIIHLNKILTLPQNEKVLEHSEKNFKTIKAVQLKEDLVRLFNQYELDIIPVVNKANKLVGVIGGTEIAGIISSETEDEMLQSRGVFEKQGSGILKTSSLRCMWLFSNLITAIIASFVVRIFEADFRSMAILAVLMPIVASMGGNAGIQTSTFFVRGVAMGDIQNSSIWRYFVHEFCVALINGMAFCVLAFVISLVWLGDIKLSMIFGVSVFIVLVCAGLVGFFIPALLKKCKLDPAISASIFITMFTDIIGFFSFLSLSHIFLL